VTSPLVTSLLHSPVRKEESEKTKKKEEGKELAEQDIFSLFPILFSSFLSPFFPFLFLFHSSFEKR